jgi:hypothetical protein
MPEREAVDAPAGAAPASSGMVAMAVRAAMGRAIRRVNISGILSLVSA